MEIQGNSYLPKNDNDELAELLATLTVANDDTLKRAVKSLTKLTTEDLKMVERIIDALLQKEKMEQP